MRDKMDSAPDKPDRDATTPFLLKLFYRTGAFHRPDEFAFLNHLPPHLTLHTWPSCTLSELSHHLAAADPPVLPDPAIGTRLAFRLIYPDTRGGGPGPGLGGSASTARFVVKDLGSVVLGDGGPGIPLDGVADPADERPATAGGDDAVMGGADGSGVGPTEASRTLAEARFVVGDYISCAILPPLADGAVARASSARTGRGAGIGQGRAANLDAVPSVSVRRENGFGRGFGGGGGRGGRYGGGGREPFGMPMGEWRRGERLPDMPPSRGRGRGRW